MFDANRFLGASGGVNPLAAVPGLDDFLKSKGFGGLDQVMKAGGFNRPSQGDLHVDQVLTNVSLAFMQGEGGFVARQAFRSIPVRFRSDVYYTYPRGEFNRDQMKERAPGTESAGANYSVETQDYRCKVYALHRVIPDQIRDNTDSPLNLDRETTMFLTMKSMLNQEIDWRDQFFSSAANTPGAVWTYVADGAAARSNPTGTPVFTSGTANDVIRWSLPNSTPIEDVRLFIRTVQESTGFRPNIMVTGREVFDILKDHPDIIGRIDNGQTPNGPAMTSKENLAALFELDEILIMEAIVNSSQLGVADNHSFIGGKNALLLYRPATAGLLTPAPGYNFLWTGFRGANGGAMRIKNMREEKIESDVIEIQSSYDHRLVAGDLGFYLNGIVA